MTLYLMFGAWLVVGLSYVFGFSGVRGRERFQTDAGYRAALFALVVVSPLMVVLGIIYRAGRDDAGGRGAVLRNARN